MRKIFFAVHQFEIIPCHTVTPKDRTDGLKYAANSKRDKRRFAQAFNTYEEAAKAVADFERQQERKD